MEQCLGTVLESATKIHATLEPAVRHDPARMAQIRDLILARYQLQNFNEARYSRFGIISGDIDGSRISALRGESGLKSVTVDSMKHAI